MGLIVRKVIRKAKRDKIGVLTKVGVALPGKFLPACDFFCSAESDAVAGKREKAPTDRLTERLNQRHKQREQSFSLWQSWFSTPLSTLIEASVCDTNSLLSHLQTHGAVQREKEEISSRPVKSVCAAGVTERNSGRSLYSPQTFGQLINFEFVSPAPYSIDLHRRGSQQFGPQFCVSRIMALIN